VPLVGVEPTWDCSHTSLSRARLPVSPQRLDYKIKLAEIASDFIINYIIKIVKATGMSYNIEVK
jgi:hypothetical protein